jgi:predicted Zn-dependent protease
VAAVWARFGFVVVAGLLMSRAVAADEACAGVRQGAPLNQAPLLLPAVQPAPDPPLDYRHRLQTTPNGWPLQATWCVWVEPTEPGGVPSATTDRWQEAVGAALAQWTPLLPIQLVPVPERAHVTIWRRRPPLGLDPAGRPRASHGRAILSLHGPVAGRVEPRVRVLISPGQRREAIQATALHELGHAFGLWGHSDDPADAMAVSPGSQPILRLSARDRATVRWLYGKPTPMRSDP